MHQSAFEGADLLRGIQTHERTMRIGEHVVAAAVWIALKAYGAASQHLLTDVVLLGLRQLRKRHRWIVSTAGAGERNTGE